MDFREWLKRNKVLCQGCEKEAIKIYYKDYDVPDILIATCKNCEELFEEQRFQMMGIMGVN